MTKVYDVPVMEAAKRLHVHPETIRRWVRAGDIEARVVRRRILLNADDIEAVPVNAVIEHR